MVNGWDSFNDVSIEILVIMLRKIDEICRPIVVNCDIDAGELVETDIMISNCQYDRHHIT